MMIEIMMIMKRLSSWSLLAEVTLLFPLRAFATLLIGFLAAVKLQKAQFHFCVCEIGS